MAKTVVNLDPEYIPWEVQEERVRRRRRKRLPPQAKAVVTVVAVLLLVGGGILAVIYQPWKQLPAEVVGSSPAPEAGGGEEDVAAGNPAADSSPLPTPTRPPKDLLKGRPGSLGLLDGLAVTYLPCSPFTVTTQAGATVGTTEDGPVVNVTGEDFILECDGQVVDLGRQ